MDYPLLDLPIDLVEDCEHSHRIAGQPSIMKKTLSPVLSNALGLHLNELLFFFFHACDHSG